MTSDPLLPLDAKLDAVELLLHSFSSAATFLNPQATRCACLYTLNFDPSGTLVGTSIQVSLGVVGLKLIKWVLDRPRNLIVVGPSPRPTYWRGTVYASGNWRKETSTFSISSCWELTMS